jgi:hypothetical protein
MLKPLSLLLTLSLMLGLGGFAFDAEAKRLGSGKSFGQSYKTAPAYAPPTSTRPAPTANATNPARPPFGGMLGGMMGGLLAGGLLGALFAGGAFQGIQMMDVLILGGIAFLLYKLMSSRRGPTSTAATATAAPAGLSATAFDTTPPRRVFDVPHIGHGTTDTAPTRPAGANNGFGADEVPFNFPPGFDLNNFLLGAREHYRTLQTAWNTADFDKIREYVTPSLVNELRAERESLGGDQHTEVLFVDAEIVRADVRGATTELSVKFAGSYRDTVEGTEEAFIDLWHLTRDTASAGAPWMIVGIESR